MPPEAMKTVKSSAHLIKVAWATGVGNGEDAIQKMRFSHEIPQNDLLMVVLKQ